MKIAILIPGLIRCWDKTHIFYKKFISDLKADVFIATELDQDISDIPNVKKYIKKDYNDDFFNNSNHRTKGGPLQLEKVKDAFELMFCTDTYDYVIRIRTDVVFREFNFSSFSAFSSDMFHGTIDNMKIAYGYFKNYRDLYWDVNNKLFKIDIYSLVRSHPFACRWLWFDFPKKTFQNIINELKPEEDEQRHKKFWMFLNKHQDIEIEIDIEDEPVSFEDCPCNKMPIEKYFGLHMNINKVIVNKIYATILR